MRNLVVNEKYNNKKLNTFLQDAFSGLNTSLFYKTLRKKDIKVNGKRINENVKVFIGDEITIFVDDSLLFSVPNIDIVYEDEFILIVNKPANIEVTGTLSLTSILSKQINCNVFPAHRLDRNTTGIVLFAKNEDVLNILLDKFKTFEIEKHYMAHIYGIPKKTKDTLKAYLFKDAKKSLVYIQDTPKTGYREIITSYQIIKVYDDNTCVLDVNLHTGRTHQIRAHLAHIGFPIIGDGKYGNNEINKRFHKKAQELCSYKIKFCFKTDAGVLNYLNNKEFKIVL